MAEYLGGKVARKVLPIGRLVFPSTSGGVSRLSPIELETCLVYRCRLFLLAIPVGMPNGAYYV